MSKSSAVVGGCYFTPYFEGRIKIQGCTSMGSVTGMVRIQIIDLIFWCRPLPG